jgi:hypothetical protein
MPTAMKTNNRHLQNQRLELGAPKKKLLSKNESSFYTFTYMKVTFDKKTYSHVNRVRTTGPGHQPARIDHSAVFSLLTSVARSVEFFHVEFESGVRIRLTDAGKYGFTENFCRGA